MGFALALPDKRKRNVNIGFDVLVPQTKVAWYLDVEYTY